MIAVGILTLLAVASAPAQQSMQPHTAPSVSMGQQDTNNPEAKAFLEANEKMRQSISGPLMGDADWDFARLMVPVDQGAIDMARIELLYGKDPDLRKLAEEIIAAQEKEVALMKEWQQRHN